jgi:Asp-tRNA(Asn)/Glu-tRNA(Gln) amidotransferase A subunit family amidase
MVGCLEKVKSLSLAIDGWHGAHEHTERASMPKTMNQELFTWSARRLAQAMAARELRAETLVRALIERSAELNPVLQVWSSFDEAKALRGAKDLDRQASQRSPRGPLHGLPLAVKDIIDVAGLPTEFGSPIFRGHVSDSDAACVALTRAAGAHVMGKTVTTELANFTPAATRNPLNPAHTPGGSSSGSAAAVAAGIVPLALGTQTAGSVIRPAAYCGIAAYKPSPRRVPRSGVKLNADTLDEVGVFARDVADAALLAEVLTGMRLPVEDSALLPAPRIGVTLTPKATAASTATVAMVARCAKRLAAAGATVADARWPASMGDLFEAQRIIQAFETARALAPEWRYRRDLLSKALAAFVEDGQRIAAKDYVQALAVVHGAQASLEDLFGGFDVLITPAAPSAAPLGLSSTGDPVFNRPWQALGCPCIALRSGETEAVAVAVVVAGRGASHDGLGLPLGLQVVARLQDDARLFAASAWIEAALAR